MQHSTVTHKKRIVLVIGFKKKSTKLEPALQSNAGVCHHPTRREHFFRRLTKVVYVNATFAHGNDKFRRVKSWLVECVKLKMNVILEPYIMNINILLYLWSWSQHTWVYLTYILKFTMLFKSMFSFNVINCTWEWRMTNDEWLYVLAFQWNLLY